MSRIPKLYERLDMLQRQLEDRILEELDCIIKHGLSIYLTRRMTPYFDGRSYRTREVAELEKLTNEVIALKEKLGESLSFGVTGIILKYEGFRNLPADQRPSTAEEIELAHRHTHELRSEIMRRGS